MTLTTIAINGVPIEQYGVEPIELSGWLRPPLRRFGSASPIGRIGSIASTRGATYEPRVLGLSVRTTAGASTDLSAGRGTLDEFHRAMRGLLEIEVADKPGRVCYGVWEPLQDRVFGIPLVSPQVESLGQVVCHDPLWYDRVPVIAGVESGDRLAVPMGTEAGRVRLMIVGAASAPTITVRSRAGEVVSTMRFDRDGFSLSSSEVLDIDWNRAMPVVKIAGGVETDAFDALNLDDTFVHLDPDDEPTIEVSDGSLIITTWKGSLS